MGASLALLLVIGYRVFVVSYLQHAGYSIEAEAQAEGSSNVLARGAIFMVDRDGQRHVVATNKRFPRLAVHAEEVSDDQRERAVGVLVDIADMERDAAVAVLADRRDLSRMVGEYLTDDDIARLRETEVEGLTVAQQTDRFYPDGLLGADAIGFFGYDPDGRHGQYGIEAFYESELAGHSRRGVPAQSLWNSFLALIGRVPQADDESSVPLPSDVELTIDRNVQAFAQEVLSGTLERYGATAGSLIVQEVTTGRLVAMADSPSFDPNRYGEAETASFMNAPVQQPFEPGSSFKPFTMAVGLDTGAVTPTSTYYDAGFVEIAGYTIRNFTDEPFGTVTMTRVLEKSINTGTMHVQRKVGNDRFLEYLINFGFGQRSGIDLPGEATGDIGNLYQGRDINFQTASFGQGITVTPLQLAVGYSAIANGGKLLRPYLVERIVRDGTVIFQAEPEIASIPIRQATAAQIREMLTSVVDNGFDKARIPRYDVAGKTGTAQIADPHGGYLEDEYIHSFAGFIPSKGEPQYTIVITMERPKGVTFASDSLSSVFKEIALFLINYYRIPPTR